MRNLTHDEFCCKLGAINPQVEPLESYISSGSKILFKCLKCGNVWKTTPNIVLGGHGCPKCAGNIKKSDAEFRAQLKSVNSQIEILEPYTSAVRKLRVKCLECGNIWQAKPNTLLMGHGCPHCSHGSSLKSNEQFELEFKEKHPSLKLLTQYAGANKPVEVECTVCGYRWSKAAVGFVATKSAGCPLCSRKKLSERMAWSEDEFKAKLKVINPNITLVGSYVNTSTKALFECELCGEQWNTKPNNVLNGHGCPKCNETGTSYMEQYILVAFKQAFPQYQVLSRCRTVIDAELDIYIPELKFAIEPGGWFWHKNELKKDKKKRALCRERNIRLITIYDMYPKDKEAPFENDCLITSNYLGPQSEELTNVTKKLLTMVGFTDELNWGLISTGAYEASRSTKQRLSDELAETARRNNLILLSGYQGTRSKIKVQCGSCGHIWDANPSDIKSGHGCPKCRYKGFSRAVRCVETGIYYSSCSEAARQTGGSASAISSAVRKGHCSGGFHWEAVED